jgi:two-component system OmpR family sensor kinase/two-component system sensor histidine kinase QseC
MTTTSIRTRLLLSLLPLFLLAEAVIGTITYRYVLEESHALFDYHLQQMALSLRDQGAVPPPPVPPEEREQFDFVVQIWSADGSKVYLSQTRSKARLPDRATLGFADVVTEGERWRVYSTLARGRVIQVGQPHQVRERIAAAAALRSLTPLVIFAPIVALAIWWLVGLALKPVLRVASELRSRDAQRLDPVSDDELPAEIEPMIRQLNGLLDRLRSAFAAQRAFVADAAHELRTPIAALKLQTGLLGRAGDEAGRADALRELNAGVDRSAHLVDQLLALARNEPGARPAAGRDAASADTDLAATARDAIAGLRTLAQARGSTVALTAPQSLPIRADPDAMQALVRNLVDNALRHSPPGSRVEVEVAQQGDEARLIVDDSGSGIPEADRDRVFDRFHRRNTGNEPGSGLGLAIVKAIVDRHDGRIELVDSPLGGLRAAVRLPSRMTS